MSITLEIITETNYEAFLKTWDGTEPYSEYEDRWEEATTVYTNFSEILSKETDEDLLDKWEYIMGYLDSVPETETLYFFTD